MERGHSHGGHRNGFEVGVGYGGYAPGYGGYGPAYPYGGTYAVFPWSILLTIIIIIIIIAIVGGIISSATSGTCGSSSNDPKNT